MLKRVHLNGGPMHDQTVTVSSDWNHFHIYGMDLGKLIKDVTEATDEGAEIEMPLRVGTYSAVEKYPNEFEWDGWNNENSAHRPHH